MEDYSTKRIVLWLLGCEGLPERWGLPTVLSYFEDQGGTWVESTEGTSNPDPIERLQVLKTENSYGGALGLKHKTLQPDLGTEGGFRYQTLTGMTTTDRTPWAAMSYWSKLRGVAFDQSFHLQESEDAMIEGIALGMLQFFMKVCLELQPTYAKLDAAPVPHNTVRSPAPYAEQRGFTFMGWMNYFSASFAEKIGRDFLKEAPGWRHVEMNSGGVMYIATQTFLDWFDNDHPQIYDYFRKVFPDSGEYELEEPGD